MNKIVFIASPEKFGDNLLECPDCLRHINFESRNYLLAAKLLSLEGSFSKVVRSGE